MQDPTGSYAKTRKCDVGATSFAGHGAEIEEDVIRLRRRHLEFEHDVRAAMIRSGPRRLRAFHPVGAALGVFARWR